MVVGAELHSLRHLDLRDITVVAEKNGDVIATAPSSAVMGNPAAAVAWLANKLAEAGLALEAGELVMSGAVIGALRVMPGDVIKATFGGGLGPIEVTLTAQASR
jgi:2-keto-4-pentenoate hydratase